MRLLRLLLLNLLYGGREIWPSTVLGIRDGWEGIGNGSPQPACHSRNCLQPYKSTLKIGIVQFFKGFMGLVPAMGMIVLVLAFLVVATSAGYFFVGAHRHGTASATGVSAEVALSTDAQKGRAIFDAECSFCHHADRTDPSLDPGLKGVLKGEKLPVSKKPATFENVREQLTNPFENMPSYKSTLSEQEIDQLIGYLETL